MKRVALRFPSLLMRRALSTRPEVNSWHVSGSRSSDGARPFPSSVVSQQARWFSDSKVTKEEAVDVPVEDKHSESDPALTLDRDRETYTIPIKVRMPDMGEGNQNVVETWFKKPGDIVKPNDYLCDIATPDFTFGMTIDDLHDAVMGEILVEEGQRADDNAPICVLYHPEDPKIIKESDSDKE